MPEPEPFLVDRLQGFGTTIFAEMSALAQRTGAVNLGQGFPDTDGPREVSEAAIAAIDGLPAASFVPEDRIDPLFTAVVQVIDEAILNSLVANETMVGRDERRVETLPHDSLRAVLKRYGRLEPD